MASYNTNQDAAAKKVEDTKLFGQQKAGEAQQATQVTDSNSFSTAQGLWANFLGVLILLALVRVISGFRI